MDTFSKILFLHIPTFSEIHVLTISERMGRTIDEESFNEILKVFDMRPISTRKREWNFVNMVPICITKQNWSLGIWESWNF